MITQKHIYTLVGFTAGIIPAIFLPLAGTVVAAFTGLALDESADDRAAILRAWTATVLGGVLADVVALSSVALWALI